MTHPSHAYAPMSVGHKVTALVRDEASLSSFATDDGSLKIVKGQPQDHADMEKAFTAVPDDMPTVVIVTLNSARTSDNPFAKPVSPPTLMCDSHLATMESMKKHGVRKIVTLQALGVGDSFPNLFWLVRLLVRYSNMSIGYKDHEKADDAIRKSGLNYVLARPIRFIDGDSAPIKFFGDKGDGIGSFNKITRRSVACFLLDAAEKSDWDGQTPIISN
jgi:hypothetical protein